MFRRIRWCSSKWHRTTRIEDYLDKATEKFKSPRSFEPEDQDLKDALGVEDDAYDYEVIPLVKGDTPQTIFKGRGWRA